MLNPNQFIDTVQNGKKQVITTFVSDETIKNSLIKVVDAQTAFVKTATETALELSKQFVENFGKPFNLTK